MSAFAGVPTGPAGPGPTGPAGPGPTGPAGPGPGPGGPPPPAPESGTGAPWPSRPGGPSSPGGPTGPGRAADDALFAAVDEVLADLAASFELPRRKPWRSFDEQGRPS